MDEYGHSSTCSESDGWLSLAALACSFVDLIPCSHVAYPRDPPLEGSGRVALSVSNSRDRPWARRRTASMSAGSLFMMTTTR